MWKGHVKLNIENSFFTVDLNEWEKLYWGLILYVDHQSLIAIISHSRPCRDKWRPVLDSTIFSLSKNVYLKIIWPTLKNKPQFIWVTSVKHPGGIPAIKISNSAVVLGSAGWIWPRFKMRSDTILSTNVEMCLLDIFHSYLVSFTCYVLDFGPDMHEHLLQKKLFVYMRKICPAVKYLPIGRKVTKLHNYKANKYMGKHMIKGYFKGICSVV